MTMIHKYTGDNMTETDLNTLRDQHGHLEQMVDMLERPDTDAAEDIMTDASLSILDSIFSRNLDMARYSIRVARSELIELADQYGDWSDEFVELKTVALQWNLNNAVDDDIAKNQAAIRARVAAETL